MMESRPVRDIFDLKKIHGIRNLISICRGCPNVCIRHGRFGIKKGSYFQGRMLLLRVHESTRCRTLLPLHAWLWERNK